jgi:hypothetical protein
MTVRSFILMACLAILGVGLPAWKADALTGYYRQFHRAAPPKKCPTGYRSDAHNGICRRIA